MIEETPESRLPAEFGGVNPGALFANARLISP
jgi:hypothetical protein